MTIEQIIRKGRIVEGMTFYQRVWAMTARIPRGKVTTYGALAQAVGKPAAARAVGGAMNNNPYAPGVPCHRVIGSDGSLTGFATGLPKKVRMLRSEGVAVKNNRVVDKSRIIGAKELNKL